MTIFGKLILGASVALCCSLPALAQNAEINNRLNRLENEIQTLNQAMFRGKSPKFEGQVAEVQKSINHISGSQTAQTEIRLNALEQQIRDLTGKVEEYGYQVRQLSAKTESFMADNNLRLQDIEARRAQAASQAAVRAAEKQGMQSVQISDPKPDPVTLGQIKKDDRALPQDGVASYEQAFALLRQGQYETAEKAFSGFLRNDPQNKLAGNAQYWLAETFYVRGLYEDAARGFAKGYQSYPESSKKADNLLKLSLSLAKLGKKQEACITLGQLDNEVPDAPAPIKRRADQEADKLGCS